MSHNSGQNIDDMLKMLKASVEKDTSDSEATGASRGRKKKSADAEMSAEDLQNELRSQFMSGDDVYGGDDNFDEEETYKLDDDFLAEAQLEDVEQEIAEEPEEEVAIIEESEEEVAIIEESEEEVAIIEESEEEAEIAEEPEETEITEEEAEEIEETEEPEEEIEEVEEAEELEELEEESEISDKDDLPWYEDDEEVSEEELIEEELVEEELVEEELVEEEPIEEELVEEELVEEELIEEELIEEELIEEELVEEELVEEELIEEELIEEELVGEELVEEELVEEDLIEEELIEEELVEEELIEEESIEEDLIEEESIEEDLIEEESIESQSIEDESIEDALFGEFADIPIEMLAASAPTATEEIEALAEESIEYFEVLDSADIALVAEDIEDSAIEFWQDEEGLDEENETFEDISLEPIYLDANDDELTDEYIEDNTEKYIEEYTEDAETDLPEAEVKETEKPYLAVLRENNISVKPEINRVYFDEEDQEAIFDEPETEEEEIYPEEEYPEPQPQPLEDVDDILGLYFDEQETESHKTELTEEDEVFDEDAEESGAERFVAEEMSEPTPEEKRDNATDLLLQFGYNAHDWEVDGGRPFDEDRIGKIRENYRRKRKNLLLSVLGGVAITIIMLFYEFLPLMDIEFGGIMNYRHYPVSYALIGLQLLAFCIAISWKKLWEGLKTLLSFSPDHNSLVAIAIIFTVIYDVVVAICQYRDMPIMFNFLAALTLNLSLTVDWLMICRESRAFEVYFSDSTKYTSVADGRKSSVAEKMYRGGLSPTQNVYIPADYTPSNTYFRALDDRHEKHKLIHWLSVPCVALTLLVWVLGIVFDRGAVESVAAAMTVMFSVLPISIVFADAMPLLVSGSRLYKRDIAVAGVGAIKRFASCNIMVFRDIHFFEKCSSKNTGMVFYDESNAQTVFKCLNAIYSELGGPMSEVFSRIAKAGDVPYSVRFTRIAANGTEAVVDGNKVVLVGTHEFMKRYGLDFPKNEDRSEDGSSRTLCVSLNGRVTAKISVKYKSAGLFEMLAERLAAEGVYCAVETYDPLINSEMLGRARLFGDAPISVVHLNLGDMARERYDEKTDNKALFSSDPIGVVVGRSRLKLAEVLVWCRRIVKIRKVCSAAVFAGSMLGMMMSLLVFFFDWNSYVSQFAIFAFQSLLCIAAVIITLLMVPGKQYFDFEVFCRELEREEAKAQAEEVSAEDGQGEEQENI